MLVCSSLPGFPLTSPVSPPGFSSVSLTKVALACSQQCSIPRVPVDAPRNLSIRAAGSGASPLESSLNLTTSWTEFTSSLRSMPSTPTLSLPPWQILAGHPGLSAAVQDGIPSPFTRHLCLVRFSRISCASSRSDHGLHYRHPHGGLWQFSPEFLHLPQIDIPVCILTVLPNSNLFSYCFLFLPGWLCFLKFNSRLLIFYCSTVVYNYSCVFVVV